MRMSTKVQSNLNWIEVENAKIVTIMTEIEDYNVTLHVKNTSGNVLSMDLTPKPSVIVNPNGWSYNGSTGNKTYNMIYAETMNIEDPIREGLE